MKKITIEIFEDKDGKLKDLIDIESNDLCITYANTPTMHGLQCNFDGDTEEFLEVEKTLVGISNLVRKLNKIYK